MVIGSCIKHIPIAGYDITKYIMNAIRDRKEDVNQADLMAVAKEAKDNHSYVSIDTINEYGRFDERVKKYGETKPDKCFRTIKTSNSAGKVYLRILHNRISQ